MDEITHFVVIVVVIVLSMTLHEAMHAFISYWLGDDTAKTQGRLTLNPIKHIDPFLTLLLPLILAAVGAPIFGGAKPVTFNPNRIRYHEWGAAMVAAAGPLTNLAIAFFTYGIYALAGAPEGGLFTVIMTTAIMVNLGFFVFNIIPIPPLDGSRVLYALAPEFVRRGMEVMEQFGLIFIFAIVLVASSAIGEVMLTVINLFLTMFHYVFGLS